MYSFLVDPAGVASTAVLVSRHEDGAHILFMASNEGLSKSPAERGLQILARLEQVRGKAVIRAEGRELGTAHVVGDLPDHAQVDTLVCIHVGACRGIPESAWSYSEPLEGADWFVRAQAA